jgi:hypothetical protein
MTVFSSRHINDDYQTSTLAASHRFTIAAQTI